MEKELSLAARFKMQLRTACYNDIADLRSAIAHDHHEDEDRARLSLVTHLHQLGHHKLASVAALAHCIRPYDSTCHYKGRSCGGVSWQQWREEGRS